jgi:hypothetical protein
MLFIDLKYAALKDIANNLDNWNNFDHFIEISKILPESG